MDSEHSEICVRISAVQEGRHILRSGLISIIKSIKEWFSTQYVNIFV